jgi:N utilization substance protein A
MSKELLLVVDAVANEKGVAKAVIFDAMEAALASAAKKRYFNEDVATRVSIDRESGDYETFRRWEVVPDDVVMESPDRMIRLMDVVDDNPKIEVGEFVEEPIDKPPSRSSCSASVKRSVRRSWMRTKIASANSSPVW